MAACGSAFFLLLALFRPSNLPTKNTPKEQHTDLSDGLIGFEMNNMLIRVEHDERVTARIEFIRRGRLHQQVHHGRTKTMRTSLRAKDRLATRIPT